MKVIVPAAICLLFILDCAPSPSSPDKKSVSISPERKNIESLCRVIPIEPSVEKLYLAVMLIDTLRAKGASADEIAECDSMVRATCLKAFKRPLVILTHEQKKEALSKMRVQKDDMRSYEFYYSKLNSKYDDVKEFGIYVAKSEASPPVLRYRIKYNADDWLFIRYYDVKFDDRAVRIAPDLHNSIERDNASGGIWEWLDEAIEDEFMTIDSISKATNVKMRYNGDQYYYDRVITEKEKTAMRDVIMAYYALGGI